MKIERPKDWWINKARNEEGFEVTAGVPTDPAEALAYLRKELAKARDDLMEATARAALECGRAQRAETVLVDAMTHTRQLLAAIRISDPAGTMGAAADLYYELKRATKEKCPRCGSLVFEEQTAGGARPNGWDVVNKHTCVCGQRWWRGPHGEYLTEKCDSDAYTSIVRWWNEIDHGVGIALADTVKFAVAIAKDAHKDQTDLNGDPYISHPMRVEALMDRDDYEGRIVALLHDVLEDRPAFTNVVRKIVPPHLFVSLEAISQLQDEPLEKYWARVKANAIARRVKLQDIADNSAEWRLARCPESLATFLRDKYARARAALE